MTEQHATQSELEAITEALAAVQGEALSPEQRIAQLEAEIASLKDQALRAAAEAENVRRRARKDVEDASKYATSNIARDLVTVIENLQRAVGAVPEGERQAHPLLTSLWTGVEMTLSEFLSVFERHGIRRVDPLGQAFDHQLHEAVVQVPDPTQAPGTVIQTIQAGYVLHDRLLRPALVAVSKEAEAPHVDTQA